MALQSRKQIDLYCVLNEPVLIQYSVQAAQNRLRSRVITCTVLRLFKVTYKALARPPVGGVVFSDKQYLSSYL